MDDPRNEELRGLVADAGRGDETAWRRLVELTAPRLFAVVRAQCRNEELAEEIVQSTFTSVVEKLDGYTEDGRFEAWLTRIAINRLRDEMRRRGRQAISADEQTIVGLAGAAEPAPPESGTSVGVDLRSALDQLSDADREIIHLRHVSGLSFKEMADVLGSPVGTLLARHHRALKKLRTLLPEDPPEGSEGGREP